MLSTIIPLFQNKCRLRFVLNQTILKLTNFKKRISIFITLNMFAMNLYFIAKLIKLVRQQKYWYIFILIWSSNIV
jgi:hypothetical protein